MDGLDGELEVRDYALERQIMLSDGVFAIAMTLLALELKAPAGWDHTLGGLFLSGWQMFFAYGMSFFAIAIFWATHRRAFGRFRRSDFMLTVFGLLQLGAVTLVPFATRLYSEAMTSLSVGDGAVLFYLGTFWVASVFGALTWGYASLKPGLMDPEVGPRSRAVVFFLTLIATPLMNSLGVLVGIMRQFWLFAGFAVLWTVITFVRRWATKADAKDRA